MPAEVDPLALERIGRYRVRRYIAGGGMSWIFEVVDPELFDARRALKLLKPGETDRETLRRFRREAELLSRIQHPHLIHIYEFGEDSGTGCSFYTMDFVEGETLAQIQPDWLAPPGEPNARGDARSLDEIVRYFLEVLSALARLHAEGVVHRDIKPQNVFVDAQGRAVLGDLGIAKAATAAGETQKGEMPGTPLYMAPEQSLSLEITTRTDVFSLGLSLYRVLTGRTVYDTVLGAESTNSLKVLRHLWNLQGAAQEFDFAFPAQVPEPLRAVIRRACRMSPEERYPSADAMAAALEDARRPPQPTAQSVAAAAPRPRAALWIGIAAAVLLALGGVYALFGGRGSREAALAARSDAEAAHALAAALVKQLDGRSGPGAAEALEDARRRVAYTEEEQADGERELADSSYVLAERQFARALEGYTRACQDLSDHWLRAAADAETQAAKAAAATGGNAALVERANALAAASAATGCSGAEAERARLSAAETLRVETGARGAAAPQAATAITESANALATGTPAPTAVPAPEPPKPAPGHRPVLPDRTAEKRAVAAAIATWNRALNARDWGALASVQKLRPGQLESYQQALSSPNVRQSVSIRWIAELSPTRFETEVVIKREERKFFVWRDAGQDRRQAIAVLEGGRWRLTGL